MLLIWQKYHIDWRIFLTVWIVYLFHLAPLPAANENRYLDLVISLVEEGRFEIDTYHHNTLDKSYYKGHYYAGAAPGPSLLAIPGYLVFKAVKAFVPEPFGQYDKAGYIRSFLKSDQASDDFLTAYPFGDFVLLHLWLSALISGLTTALTAVMLYRCARHISGDEFTGQLTALALAFGSICFFYAIRLYAHNVSTFFLFSAFMTVHPWCDRDRLTSQRLACAGLLAGLSVVMDYSAGPISGILILYMLWQTPRTQWLYPVAGIGICAVGMMLYHYIHFGHPLTTPYSLPTDPSSYGSHAEYQEGLGGFSLPPLSRFWDLTFGGYRGIFIYMPIALAALIGLIVQARRTTLSVWHFVLAAFVLQMVFTSAMRYWYGGWDFGARYMVPALPFLFLGLASDALRRWRKTLLSLTAVSVLINWCGAQFGPGDSVSDALSLFVLSGPTTPLHSFMSVYFSTYTNWDIAISASGVYIVMLVTIFFIWKITYVKPRGHDIPL